MAARARSSVGERSLHTREVAGSKPAAPMRETAAVAALFVDGNSDGRYERSQPHWCSPALQQTEPPVRKNSMSAKERVTATWDAQVGRWLAGGDALPDILEAWWSSYRGTGLGTPTR